MTDHKLDLKMKPADALVAGAYYRWYRYVEIFGIIAFFVLMALIVRRTAQHADGRGFLVASAVMAGYLMADFISGFVHWLADTWGHTNMRYIGNTLIRPFREHHVDPKAITRHDFVEINGNNCLISLWVGCICLFMPLDWAGYEALLLFGMVSLGSMIFWVMMTNQFHKWSHENEDTLPAFVKALQRWHLILPIRHHGIHHTAPFDKYYCITTGWLNWPLTKIQFFRTLEKLVTLTTGVIPRADDIGLDAAIRIAPAVDPAGTVQHQPDTSRP
jgi:ubiquitin-conjugating enzyme E2 variant